jgi:hypothetical protein
MKYLRHAFLALGLVTSLLSNAKTLNNVTGKITGDSIANFGIGGASLNEASSNFTPNKRDWGLWSQEWYCKGDEYNKKMTEAQRLGVSIGAIGLSSREIFQSVLPTSYSFTAKGHNNGYGFGLNRKIVSISQLISYVNTTPAQILAALEDKFGPNLMTKKNSAVQSYSLIFGDKQFEPFFEEILTNTDLFFQKAHERLPLFIGKTQRTDFPDFPSTPFLYVMVEFWESDGAYLYVKATYTAFSNINELKKVYMQSSKLCLDAHLQYAEKLIDKRKKEIGSGI